MTTDPVPVPIEDTPAAIELLASLRPLFAAAFETSAFGEPLFWDITWALMGVNGQPKPMLLCYVHTPAPFPLGVSIQHWWIMELGANEDAINAEVAKNVEALKQRRIQLVYQQMAAGNGAPQTPAVPGRIILPGQ